MKVMQVEGLWCGYRDFSLQDINFYSEREEIIGVIGPNGAGKTTLLRALSGVIAIDRGAVSLWGKPLKEIGRRELARNLAVVGQVSFQGGMSVEEYVLLGRMPHYRAWQFLEERRDFEVGQEAMALTDTLAIRDHYLSQISAGQIQLAALARALAQEPRLLLLDEPISHLDIAHQGQILGLIKKLHHQKKISVIMVMHDINLAAQFCHRIIFLESGRIMKCGTPQEVLTGELIERIYNVKACVSSNPLTSTPHIFWA